MKSRRHLVSNGTKGGTLNTLYQPSLPKCQSPKYANLKDEGVLLYAMHVFCLHVVSNAVQKPALLNGIPIMLQLDPYL